jgi:hypothetical protein
MKFFDQPETLFSDEVDFNVPEEEIPDYFSGSVTKETEMTEIEVENPVNDTEEEEAVVETV